CRALRRLALSGATSRWWFAAGVRQGMLGTVAARGLYRLTRTPIAEQGPPGHHPGGPFAYYICPPAPSSSASSSPGWVKSLPFSAQRIAAIVTAPNTANPANSGCTVPLNICPTAPPINAPPVVETKPVTAVAVPARWPIGSRLIAVKLV